MRYHLRFLLRERMLTGILQVLRLLPQCTFWRFLAWLHLGVAPQLLEVQRRMRERVWEAAHVRLTEATLDTDTTVHTLFGNQTGARKTSRLADVLKAADWKASPRTDTDGQCEFCYQPAGRDREPDPGSQQRRRPGAACLQLLDDEANWFQIAMLAYNLNCWLLLFNREETETVETLCHPTLATALRC